MIREAQIALANSLLSTGVVDKVYHSVSIYKDDKGEKFPVYVQGGKEYYIGPTDTKSRFAYIRQTGPVQRGDEVREGSEKKLYRLAAPNRIVVFRDHETEDIDTIVRKLLKPIFSDDVTLVSYQHDPFTLGKTEAPVGEFVFDATTLYVAIDVVLRWWVDEKDCEEPCIIYPNPVCL